MTENPADLLGDLKQLRRKVRRDRHGYAFPLLLFGILILAAALCYVPAHLPMDTSPEGLVFEGTAGPFPAFGYTFMPGMRYPMLIEWYWMLALLVGFAATTWWYRRRADVIGVETDTRSYVITAGAALIGFVFGVQVLEATVAPNNTLYSTPEVNLPILFVSAVTSAVVFLVGQRWKKWRPLIVFVGTLLAMVALAAVGVYMINGLVGLLVVAAALLVLAWAERSALLGVIGVLFTAAALHANLQGLAIFLGGSGAGRLEAFENLMLPGGVLIIGGVIALLQSRRAAR